MASWADQPQLLTQFAPYRAENPVDAMLTVGITRQRKFEEGVQKVQTYIDTLNGFDISKKEIKDYISAKMSELHKSVNNVSGDFSDQRLINQIGGAAAKIANDPVVQNGIIATNAIRSGFQQIEQARKEGKSAPQNEWIFQNAVSQWQGDGQFDTKFSGNFTPYINPVEEIRKVFKDMNPGQDLTEDALRIDSNGNVVINETLKEGLSTERIQSAINLILSRPDIQNQLSIDGQFKFRGMDGLGMFNYIKKSTEGQIQLLNDAITKTQAELSLSTKGNKIALSNQIKILKSQAEKVLQNANSLTNGLQNSVEGVKAQITADELRSNLLGSFAYEKMVQNPLWNTQMEKERLQLSKDEFTYRQLKDENDRQFEYLKFETTKAQKEAEKSQSTYVGDLPVPSEEGDKGSSTMYTLRENLLTKASDAQAASLVDIADEMKVKPPYAKDPQTGQWRLNVGPDGYETREKAMTTVHTLLYEASSKASHGIATPKVQSAVKSRSDAWSEYDVVNMKIQDIEKQYKPQLDQILQIAGTKSNGTRYEPEYFDAYIVMKNLPGKDLAKKRLEGKYGKNWSEEMNLTKVKYNMRGDPVGESDNPDWKNFKERIGKNTSAIQISQNVENAFRAAQSANQYKAVFFDRSKPETQRALDTKFTSALNEQSLIPGQGDADDVLKLLNQKDKEYPNNQYYGYTKYDAKGNKVAILGIKRADNNPKEVAIKADVFERLFPEARVNDEFNRQYGTRLALNNGKSTYANPKDVDIEGGVNSSLPLETTSSTYNVQYHLIESGRVPGTYNIRLWVTDKKTGSRVVNGEMYSPQGTGDSMNSAQIMEQLKILRNGSALDAYIKFYYPQQ